MSYIRVRSSSWSKYCVCLLVVAVALNNRIVMSQSCFREDIPFGDLGGGGSSERFPSLTQAIVTSYEFQCCGDITAWQTYVEPSGGNHRDGEYSIIFQVWRPSPSVDIDGCYDIVGDDRYTDIQLIQGEDGLVNRTLDPSSFISVQPGDVLGYYTYLDDENGGIQHDPNFDTESVWYHTHTDDDPLMSRGMSCPFPVGEGTDRVLTTFSSLGPVFSIDIASYPCQTTLSPTEDTTTDTTTTTTTTTSSTSNPTSTATPVLITTPSDGVTIEIIVGVVVTMVLLVLVVMVVIILTLILLKRRMAMKGMKMTGMAGVADFSNPNYETPSMGTSFAKSTSKKSKGHKKKGSHSSVPAPIALDITETAMYESLDNHTNNEHHPSDYTYPNPNSNTSTYTYITTQGNGNGSVDGMYHMLGADLTRTQQYDTIVEPPPLPSRKDGPGKQQEVTAFYHMLEAEYEDPEVQLRLQKGRDIMFDSIGSYVPTEEQREHFIGNYEQQNETATYNRLRFFEEDQIYWAPASNTSDLYAQLASKKYREIHRNQIRIIGKLGSGQFGEVCKATWTVNDLTLELAVKMLISGASEEDKIKFLQEAAIMGQFSHPNVIKLHGVVTVGEPVMLCSELLSHGDLRSYLQEIDLSTLTSVAFTETQQLFLRFSRDIAAGMEYLSGKSFVHRDLAARNILLDDSLTCKVGDFGMARDLMDDSYYKSTGGKIPVKWTAPEALLYKKYSPASDVWSYGMVLFEIWSIGKKPFSTITNHQVLRLIQTGFCQPPPPGCPRGVYQLMVHCWNPDHERRPDFKQLCNQYLQSPEILHWSDDHTHAPSVAQLGAPLEKAFKLHLYLQETYKSNVEI